MKNLCSLILCLLLIVPKTHAKTEKPVIVPAVLLLLAEATTADLVLLGVGTTATAVGVTYYVQNPPTDLNLELPSIEWGVDEVSDAPSNPSGPVDQNSSRPTCGMRRNSCL